MSTLNETQTLVKSELLKMLTAAYLEGWDDRVLCRDTPRGTAWVRSDTYQKFLADSDPLPQEQLRGG